LLRFRYLLPEIVAQIARQLLLFFLVQLSESVILLNSVTLIFPTLTVEHLSHDNDLLATEDVALLKNVILALVAMLHVPVGDGFKPSAPQHRSSGVFPDGNTPGLLKFFPTFCPF